MVDCPICGRPVKERDINSHIDSACQDFVVGPTDASQKPASVASFFHAPAAKRAASLATTNTGASPTAAASAASSRDAVEPSRPAANGPKRCRDVETADGSAVQEPPRSEPPAKRPRPNALERAAPLAERMRPTTLDEVCGQDLVGPNGVIRGLVEHDRVPSMILWGGPGTGKTTLARIIATTTGSRFVEINSTSSGVAECKKLFADALNELKLTGRKTIIFCDEIHRFSKSQQDVFLGPVEAGTVTLVGATTENPSFRVVDALLSRCRTFTLSKLTDAAVTTILQRALAAERGAAASPLLDASLLACLSSFAAGDARAALNLLELALSLSADPGATAAGLKAALSQTLVYDRAGEAHYDTISAFHKSIRGSDPDAALFYLARMLAAGEDPLYIARRLVVVASEDVGLADNAMLPLATAALGAAEKLGMPECRVNLAHATAALALAPKSTRAYRALGRAVAALAEPGVAAATVPPHLRNAPTRLLREMGVGAQYKYPPDYAGGRVRQEYLPEALRGRRFLDERDLGTLVDPEVEVEVEVEIGGGELPAQRRPGGDALADGTAEPATEPAAEKPT